MSVNENGNLRPDGVSVSLPGFLGRWGGTYYWNPGSPTAPNFTVTRTYGLPGLGLNAVFLRPGMTSQETLGHGVSGNLSTGLPSVTLNGTIPDGGYQPLNSRRTSFEVGIGTPNASPAATDTYTPQQIADKYISSAAMGPDDELPPFVRTLQSGVGTVGENSAPPVRFLGARIQNPLGNGMADWSSSIDPTGPPYVMQPASSPQEPGGLPGMMLDYLRNNSGN